MNYDGGFHIYVIRNNNIILICDPPQDAHRTFDSHAEEVVKLLTTPESSPHVPKSPEKKDKENFLKSFDGEATNSVAIVYGIEDN